VLVERNLFRPERRARPVGKTQKPPEEAPTFPKEPKLTGVTERDGERSAFLRVYDSKKDQGRLLEVGVGSGLQGWTVTEIRDTTLTLAWNDQQVLVDMMDSGPVKAVSKRAKKVASLNIIRIGKRVEAVETTTPGAPKTEKNRGLEVGLVGAQRPPGRGARSNLLSRRTASGGRSGGTLGQKTLGRSLPSTVGAGRPSAPGLPNQR
jgi:hypothetical protein